MRLIPIVALVDEQHLPALDEVAADMQTAIPDVVAGVLDRNPGWTIEALAAGMVINQVLRGDA